MFNKLWTLTKTAKNKIFSEKENFAGNQPDKVQPLTKEQMEEEEIRNYDSLLKEIGYVAQVRYPPAEIGIPAVIPGWYLLRKQKDLTDRILKELQLREQEQALFEEAMVRFADYVHLLPASENHHHRGQGGLLRHSLEVCSYAVKQLNVSNFDASAFPVEKSERAMAWKLAVFIGSLLHDAGKPVTDMEIWDESGKEHWPVGISSIYEWSLSNNIKKYYIYWKPGRFQKHHSASASMIKNLIPDQMLDTLLKTGNDIYSQLLEALGHIPRTGINAEGDKIQENQILSIIIKSDCVSVQEDLVKFSGDAVRAAETGVPIVQKIVDTMRMIYRDNLWKVNEAGNPLWVTEKGVFIVWEAACKQIVEKVKELGVVIPHSHFVLSSLMKSHNLIIPNAGTDYEDCYWKLAPEILNTEKKENGDPRIVLECVLLKSPDLIFSERVVPSSVSSQLWFKGCWHNLEVRKVSVPEIKKDFREDPLQEIRGETGTDENNTQRFTAAENDSKAVADSGVSEVSATDTLSSQPTSAVLSEKQSSENKPVFNPVTSANFDSVMADVGLVSEKKVPASETEPAAESVTEQPDGQPPASQKKKKLSLKNTPSLVNPETASGKKFAFSLKDQPVQTEKTEQTAAVKEKTDEITPLKTIPRLTMEIPDMTGTAALNKPDDKPRFHLNSPACPSEITGTAVNSISGVLPGHSVSALFEKGTDEARRQLHDWSERTEKFEHSALHLIFTSAEMDWSVFENCGWLWKPFMRGLPGSSFSILIKSRPCYLLKKELISDVNRFSQGRLFTGHGEMTCAPSLPEHEFFSLLAVQGQLYKKEEKLFLAMKRQNYLVICDVLKITEKQLLAAVYTHFDTDIYNKMLWIESDSRLTPLLSDDKQINQL